MFTLRVMIDGHVQIEQPNLSFDRLRSLLQLIETAIPTLQAAGGKVGVVVESESAGICHTLGNHQ